MGNNDYITALLGAGSKYILSHNLLPAFMFILHYISVNTDQPATHDLSEQHGYAVSALEFQFGSFTVSPA